MLSTNLTLGFDRPAYLLLLFLLPAIWVLSYRALAPLGPVRRWLVLGLRSLLAALLILALAELQVRQLSDRVTVVYILDQSESIPRGKRDLMREYVIQAVRAHRRSPREDRAGVILFGREATVEYPPYDDEIPDTGAFESILPRLDATNLQAALKLAQASFTEDTAKRIVLVTDGNENLGSARMAAPALTANGIGIDVVPVRLDARAEVAVEKVALPSDIRRATPFQVRTVLSNYAEPRPGEPPRTVRGRLTVTRSVGAQEEPVGQQDVELPPGKTVIAFNHVIDMPAMYTYRARFVPDDPHDDLLPQNNQASAFTYVRGKGRILLIEDRAQPGEFDFLVERLGFMNLEIEVRPSDQAFQDLAELQGFDCVILADVARSSGDESATITGFRDEQIQMLVRNTAQLGAGLIMLGGPNSFGAGGWANTELEKAMPVDFQIKNARVQAVGALVLTMHASEMPQGNHWQKVVAREAIKSLGPLDYCGVVHWDNLGGDAWLWGGNIGLIRIGERRDTMLALLGRMTPGDMPDFESSMQLALASFSQVKASVKHMIIISDGDPTPPSSLILARFRQAGIKITTVAVSTHGPPARTPLKTIADATGGNYYEVTNPQMLPKIYQREARRVTRPVVQDLDDVSPRIVFPHEILQGIEGDLPPLKGMVLTTVKDNPLVEVVLRSPEPADPVNATVLAAWTYGLGRAVAFTTDAGRQWAKQWTTWPGYNKFFSQMVRWAMRPSQGRGEYAIATDVRDGQVRVVITALDAENQFRNLLRMSAEAVAPDLTTLSVPIRQEAPGRYVGQFPADQAGSYHITVVPGGGDPPLATGVNVPYSAEYRDHQTNFGLLESLASLTPTGGHPGVLVPFDLTRSRLVDLLGVDHFRADLPPAFSVQDTWPVLLWVAAFVLFADVLLRRVVIGTAWLRALTTRVRQRLSRRELDTGVEQSLRQLRARKEEVARTLDEQRARARFEPGAAEEPPRGDAPAPPAGTAPPTEVPGAPATLGTDAAEDEETTSYTSRLLEAKRQVWKRNPQKPDER